MAANLLMLALILGGLLQSSSIKQEIFPEISLDMVVIAVPYPGAGPEEVEEGIILKVEESLTSIDGITQIKSIASEGNATIMVELDTDKDSEIMLQDIKAAVDRIVTFPEDAEKPIITKPAFRQEVISLVVYGDASERTLREQAELIREELLAKPKVTQVDISGVRPYEISIEVSEDNLRRFGLTIGEVTRKVRSSSIDFPAGSIKTSGGEVLLRTKERKYVGEEYGEITALVSSGGVEVKLKEIANVIDGFSDIDQYATFDGKPAVMIKVFRVGDQKPVEIATIVKDYAEDKGGKLPDSLGIATWGDRSEIFKGRMDLLLRNAILGLILVVIILGLFLEIRLAFWVMLGIPISFLGAMLFMPAFDMSINMISMFAFILALGIVVDDAIIVGENIFEHRQQGKPYAQASIDGALEVFTPVFFSVLTTIVAFLPLLFVTGMMGKFIKVIPVVVISVLIMSLVESLFILPSHLSKGRPRKSKFRLMKAIERVRLGFGSRLDRIIKGPYRRFLDTCLTYRYTTVAVGIAVMLLTVGLVRGGVIKFQFMPSVDADVVVASIKMPPGTNAEVTTGVQELILQKAYEVVEDYDKDRPEGDSILRNIYSVMGSINNDRPMESGAGASSHLAEIAMFLTESQQRGVSSAEIGNRWRQAVGEVPGADNISFASSLMHMGAQIDIRMAHKDFSILEKASDRIKEALKEYPGVGDIADSYNKGKRELKLTLKPEARTLGITEDELGRQIRNAFFGSEALRIQRGRNEVRVIVRYPKEERKHLWDLESMLIRTPTGGEIALSQAAEITVGQGFSSINRTDRKRVVNVTASVDRKSANAEEILADIKLNLLPGLAADYPGLSFDMEGEAKERGSSMGSMSKGFIFAILSIFAILAIPFRSYSSPIIIMAAIPFGLVGAVLGHLIMGFDLSILSVFGVVALTGVVVNDSLLLIDKVNRNRIEGKNIHDAVVFAGMRRFRPILLTSLTTFFGLMPMMLETSVQAQFLIPMAISLAFGIIFATNITLLLIPSLYMILEDFRGKIGLKALHRKYAASHKSAD